MAVGRMASLRVVYRASPPDPLIVNMQVRESAKFLVVNCERQWLWIAEVDGRAVSPCNRLETYGHPRQACPVCSTLLIALSPLLQELASGVDRWCPSVTWQDPRVQQWVDCDRSNKRLVAVSRDTAGLVSGILGEQEEEANRVGD